MTTALRPAPSARNVAFAVIRDVFGPDARGAAESLDHHLRKSSLDQRDRAFVTELAYGTIERRRWLDWQLEPYLGARAAKLPQMIAEILRLGTYQLRAMRVHEYAAVSESVQLARRFGHPGTAGLVNAVLRRVSTDPERPVTDADFASPDDVLGTRASLPTWLVRMWRERFGDELLRGNPRRRERSGGDRHLDRPPPHDARGRHRALGRARDRRRAVAVRGRCDRRDGRGARAGAARGARRPRRAARRRRPAFPSTCSIRKPGERILEACSGRGNKTLQLASATADGATIVAIDTDARKIARAHARLAEAGVASVELRNGDASALDGSETFDAILVDAPCSGIGIIGRQPEARWRKTPEDGARLAPLQRSLLESAARALAPAGRLVYAVCSTDRARERGRRRTVSRRASGARTRRAARALCAVCDGGRRRARRARHRRPGRILHRGDAPAVNAIARFERLCARVVEGTFARIFPSALEPAQVGRKLIAAQAATPTDTYLVRVHPVDYARFAGDRAFLEARWSAMLREGAPGRESPHAILHEDPDIVAGSVTIEAIVDDRPAGLALVRPDGEAIALLRRPAHRTQRRQRRRDRRRPRLAPSRAHRRRRQRLRDRGSGFVERHLRRRNAGHARAPAPRSVDRRRGNRARDPWLIRVTPRSR